MTVTDHISETDLQSFCSGLLPAMDTILCAEHLEACPQCSRLYTRISQGRASSKADERHFSPETYLFGQHLDYEKISDYLDHKLIEGEIESVKLHLKFCRNCTEEVVSLKEFRKSLEKELSSEHPRQGFIGKIISSIRKPRLPNPVYVFGALTVLILLSLIMIVIYRQRSREVNEPRHVKATPTPYLVDDGQPEPSSSPRQAGLDRRKVKSAKSNRAEIIYDNGKQFIVTSEGARIRIGNLARELHEDAVKVLQGQSIVNPALLEELAQLDANVRGGNEKNKASLLSPVGTLIVEDRPVLKWKGIEGATGYVVDIVDEKFNPITQSPHLESTEWKVEVGLKRDAVYLWQVTVFKDKERIDDRLNQVGKFKIVSEKKVDEVRRARKKYGSRLELGVYYLREGFIEEVERECKDVLLKKTGSRFTEKMCESISQAHKR